MHKIRRVYLDEIGYKSAVFKKATIDLLDPHGVSHHAILKAANGNGKTTLVSFIFNMMQPTENMFLASLIHSHYKFEQYFGTRPGVVAIEWEQPNGRHIVTLQIIVPMMQAGNMVLKRHFAAFRTDGDLSLDSLPFCGLGTEEARLSTHDDVKEWLARMSREHAEGAAGFQHTTNIAEWRRLLSKVHRIDVDLAAALIQFCREEGGIDKFLKFSNEPQFIEKFFSIILSTTADPERANPRAQVLHDFAKRHENYAVLRGSQDFYGKLSGEHGKFSGHAAKWRGAREENSRAHNEAVAIRVAVNERVAVMREEIVGLQQEIAAIEQTAAEQTAMKTLQSRRAKAADIRQRTAAHEEAKTAFDAAETAYATSSHELKRHEAASALKPILDKENKAAALQEALRQAGEDDGLITAREQMEQAARVLDAVLVMEFKTASEALRQIEAQITEVRAFLDKGKETSSRLSNDLIGAEAEARTIQNELEKGDAALQKLRTNGTLLPDEAPETATRRLDREQQDTVARQNDLETEMKRLVGSFDAAKADFADKDKVLVTVTSKLDESQRDVETAARQRQKIVDHPAFQKMLGEMAEIGNTTLERIGKLRQSRVRQIRDLEAEVTVKEHDVARIHRHGLAGVDDDCEAVIDFLAENGLNEGIWPASAYLANVLDDEAEMRDFADRDPAGFSGVFVNDVTILNVAKTLDFGRLGLTRPVRLSVSHVEPDAASDGALTVIPMRSEVYDVTAARKLAEDSETVIQDLKDRIGALTAETRHLDDISASIRHWVEQWGEGRLEEIMDNMARLNAEKGSIETRLSALKSEIESLSGQITDIQGKLDSLKEILAGIASKLLEIGRWDEAYGQALEDNRARLEELAQTISELETRAEDHEAAMDEAREKDKQLADEKSNTSRRRGDLAAERNGLDIVDGDIPESFPPLNEARIKYHTSLSSYDKVASKQIGGLKDSLDTLRGVIADDVALYAQSNPDFADRPDDIVELATAVDLADRLRHAKERDRKESTNLEIASKTLEETGKKAPPSRIPADVADIMPEFEELSSMEALASKNAAESLAENADQAAARAKQKAGERKEESGKIEQNAKLLTQTSQYLPNDMMAMPAILPEAIDTVLNVINAAVDAYGKAQKAFGEAERKVGGAYENLRQFLNTADFPDAETAIVQGLLATEAFAAAENFEGIASSIAERQATINQDLQALETDRAYASKALANFLHDSFKLLDRAVKKGRIPNDVPTLGGKDVLKMRFKPPAMSNDREQSIYDETADAYLREVVSSGNVPLKDHEIAAQMLQLLLRKTYPEQEKPKFGLKLIKMFDHGAVEYVDIDKFGASGGELLTSALLLYMVVASLRNEHLTSEQKGGGIGGFIILDNPFAKVSAPILLRIVNALADRLGLQLIFTTHDASATVLGEYSQLITVRKETQTASGRITVALRKVWTDRRTDNDDVPFIEARQEAA